MMTPEQQIEQLIEQRDTARVNETEMARRLVASEDALATATARLDKGHTVKCPQCGETALAVCTHLALLLGRSHELEKLHDRVRPFILRNVRLLDDPVGVFEQDAQAFYDATGYLAPGKSLPAEMGDHGEDARQRAWTDWSRDRRQKSIEELRAVAMMVVDIDEQRGVALALAHHIDTKERGASS